MLISALPKLAMTKETCKRMMEVLAWSWQVLWDGVVPKKDKAGDPIEKHRGKRMRKGVLWSVSGDLEWFAPSAWQINSRRGAPDLSQTSGPQQPGDRLLYLQPNFRRNLQVTHFLEEEEELHMHQL